MNINKIAEFEAGYKELKEDIIEGLNVIECINLNIVNDWEAIKEFSDMMRDILVNLEDIPEIDVKDLIVVYDDLALPPGKMRMRPSGSSGGQKGIQNIIDLLGTSEIKRIRIGIGEPRFNTVDYVLGVPTGDEAILIDQAIDKAVNAVKVTLKEGFDKAMAKCNG